MKLDASTSKFQVVAVQVGIISHLLKDIYRKIPNEFGIFVLTLDDSNLQSIPNPLHLTPLVFFTFVSDHLFSFLSPNLLNPILLILFHNSPPKYSTPYLINLLG